jgi:serine protease Do
MKKRLMTRFPISQLINSIDLGRLAAWSLVILCYAIPVQAEEALVNTIKQIKPSVVGIGTVLPTRQPPGQLMGTGFAVGNGRLIVTNAHVVAKELALEKKEFLAVFIGSEAQPEIRSATKKVADLAHDLVLLEISGTPLPPLKLSKNVAVQEGQRYAFTGFPIGAVLGLFPATHRGIISAITPIATPALNADQLTPAKIKQLRTPFQVYQLDATAYPGNSGSPLYAPNSGLVIGVINKVFVKQSREDLLSKPSGITYAIPATYVHQLLQRAGRGQ